MEEEKYGFCFRCEHRAQFLETGRRPRLQCGDLTQTLINCYMYRPVKPVLLKKEKGDRRPEFAGIISAREDFVEVATNKQVELNIKRFRKGNMIFWAPVKNKRKK